MAENTARRGIYLPQELDDWYTELADKSGIKVNQLMLDALNEYKDKQSLSKKKSDLIFKKRVTAIIDEILEKRGYYDTKVDKTGQANRS